MQVVQKAPALADHHEKAATRAVVLLVPLQVFGQMVDALGEERNLHVRRAGILLVQLEWFNRLCFSFHTGLFSKKMPG